MPVDSRKVGILFVGFVTGMFLTSTPGIEIPVFEPLAAVGGAMWMLGNLMLGNKPVLVVTGGNLFAALG